MIVSSTTAATRRRFLVALASTSTAALLRLLLALTLEPKPPLLLLFLGAVVFAAWFGGFGPGLLSTALGCVLGLFFIEPLFSPAVESMHDLIDTGIFALLGVTLSWLCGQLHAARLEAEARSRELLRASAAERAWKDRYEVAVRASGHVLYDIDFAAGQVTFGGACEVILGYTCDELGGDLARWRGLLHPSDLPVYDRVMPARRASEGLLEIEYRVRHRGGEDRTIHDVGQPLRGPDGQVGHVVGFLKDVTEQRRAEQAMRASEERLRLAVAVTGIGVTDAVFLADGSVRVEWTPEARAFVGLGEDEEVTLAGVFARLHPDDRVPVGHALAAALAPEGSGVYRFECRFVRPGDAPRWVACHGLTLFEGEPRAPVRSVGILRDITERRRIEEALRVADQHKDAFIATLAHELRNPLAPIRHAVALLQGLPERSALQVRNLAMIGRQIGHMARLLDDLLDMSRVSRGVLELQRARVAVAEVVERAVEIVRPMIDARGHDLEIEVPAAPLHIDADLPRLTQVVVNLLVNATKYTEPGGRVRVRVTVEEAEVVIAVVDSGIGLEGEQLTRSFEMFAQGASIFERSQGGLGIGLALARGLVEMHGGTLTAHSAGRGLGSEFVIRLPRVEAPAPAPQPAAPTGVSWLACRILVADDNVDNAETLAMLLGMHGGDVRVAHDGAEAVALAREFRPEVVILDIGMPRMDGHEACRRIRELPGGERIVMVAQTGWAQPDDRRRSREAGFDLHVTKPVDPDELMRAVAELQRERAGVAPGSHRVLIIDDDEELRVSLAELLLEEGFEVLAAASGPAGLALATGAVRPDAILLDYRMPGFDGGQVYERLRSAGLGGAVILVTAALAGPELASRHGIPQVLGKPFEFDALLVAIDQAIHRSAAE